jgi:hypothetical protein
LKITAIFVNGRRPYLFVNGRQLLVFKYKISSYWMTPLTFFSICDATSHFLQDNWLASLDSPEHVLFIAAEESNINTLRKEVAT